MKTIRLRKTEPENDGAVRVTNVMFPVEGFISAECVEGAKVTLVRYRSCEGQGERFYTDETLDQIERKLGRKFQ